MDTSRIKLLVNDEIKKQANGGECDSGLFEFDISLSYANVLTEMTLVPLTSLQSTISPLLLVLYAGDKLLLGADIIDGNRAAEKMVMSILSRDKIIREMAAQNSDDVKRETCKKQFDEATKKMISMAVRLEKIALEEYKKNNIALDEFNTITEIVQFAKEGKLTYIGSPQLH